MVNIVLAGTGDIALKRHIPGLCEARSAVLYGFYNRTSEKALDLSKKYDARFYPTWEAVLNDPQADAVLICTPPSSHAQLACEALRAGKHVLLEKPMAETVRDARLIEKAADESGRLFMMLHVQRFYKPHMYAKEIADSGQIGTPLSIRTILCNADQSLLSGQPMPDWHGALANIGIHRIDLLRYLTSSEVTGVFCRSCRQIVSPTGYTTESDEYSSAILEFANGMSGMLITSRTSFHGEDRATQIIGTRGMVAAYYGGHDLVVETSDNGRRYYDLPDAHPQNVLELTDIHERFCQAIEKGQQSPVTAHDGVRSIEILEALKSSNRSQSWVSLGA